MLWKYRGRHISRNSKYTFLFRYLETDIPLFTVQVQNSLRPPLSTSPRISKTTWCLSQKQRAIPSFHNQFPTLYWNPFPVAFSSISDSNSKSSSLSLSLYPFGLYYFWQNRKRPNIPLTFLSLSLASNQKAPKTFSNFAEQNCINCL